uniref:zonadhesin-like isoform X2 n=1 Tax=Scatophagus argus TaxID=75038 RepID=UPI001ED839B8|nr:zonadhesin-like isoform X2 [Scatophagus argus]
MLGGIHTDLLVAVTILFLTQTGTQCKAENDFSLVTLPDWRTNSEYVTQCDNNLICDWTRNGSSVSAAEDVAVNMLKSGPLGMEGEACLEFWYLTPAAAKVSELQVLLKSSVGLVEIWTSPGLPGDSWRQVFVPLTITEPGTQVVLKASSAVSMEGQVVFNRIGVRKGSCGQQCESNTELWTDESTRCLCSVGQLSCSPSQCPEGQICGRQTESSGGISASGTCTIHSNRDCSTFDGALFRFMSSCTYTLAKTCSPNETLPLFSVEVVSVERGNSSLPTVQQVIVEMGNLRVSLLKKQTRRVVVNGIWRKLPLKLSNSTVSIKSNPAAVILETTSGLSVSYDTAGAVHVTLPSIYSDHVCGLCGNFNYLRGDDFRKRDGIDAQDATALAESLQTGQTTSSCDTIPVPHQCDPLEEAEYASELYCGGILSSTGPFAECLAALGAESYFRSCVVGMCSTHGDLAVLCETLQDYADICREAGVAIPIWRNSTVCSHQCGENSHYNSCADGCPEVCSSLDIAGPCGSCVERCECDSGFKLSGGKCVPAEDCGCWYHGNHYDRGETWLQGECAWKCQCVGENVTQCTKMQCADNEICKVKDGIKGCYLLSPATCSVYGDPHYITFDGMAYDFQGGCSYTLATTCGEESSVQFTVVGHNMHPPLQNVTRSKLEAVTLQVEDLHLTLKDSGQVDVNNVQVQLPYSTEGAYGSVRVDMKNNFIVLETTFGLRMMIDGQNRLFLQVDERYKYELCGLCGTYSDQQDDDFITSGGQNVTEPFEFGDSWRVPDDDECVAHPNNPRLCDYEEENDAYNECYTLLRDAFKSCHELIHPSIYINSCVYDYCATNGDQHTLCESLKSYAAACQVAGVELPHWQTDTACVCPMNCNFEENLCGWEQLIQDSFDWTRNSGSTPSNLTGPNQDHTTGAGFYMYIEGNSATYGDSARLLSSVCHYNGPLCLQFWYHMYGSATAMALNIYLLKDNKVTKLWSMMNNQGPKWHPVYLDISVSGPFQIIIEGIRGSGAKSDVAIDDISIHIGSCSGNFPGLVSGTELPSTTVEILPSYPVCNIDCSFDSNLCSWNQMVTDAFDWTWQSGSTPTLMTGPSADHTGDGHYLYIEANSVTHGDTARLISSECSDSGPQCLQFWYHMYGSADTMGLNVYLLQDRKVDTVWQKRNDQGNMWHLAQLDFTTTRAFQIIIEGRRGSNEESDVAIDDVKLYHGRCSDLSDVVTNPPKPDGDTTALPSINVPTTAAQETPLVNVTDQLPVTPQPPVANVTIPSAVQTTTPLINKDNVTEAPTNKPPPHPVCQLHCDFEQDLCQWNQLLTDVFDWTRHTGSTPTMMTGPSSDHTTGDGHYLYIEANSVTHGDTARLISSECSDSGPQCLQFWYHMYGSADTMGLNVYLLQDRKVDPVWQKRNDQGNMWHLAQLDFTTTGAFQIIFEGRRGSNDQSDVAIDDVSLHHGHCADLGKPTNPAPTTFNPPTTEGTGLPPEISSTQPQTSTSSETDPASTFTTTTATTTPTTTTATTNCDTLNTRTTPTTVTPKTSNPDFPTSSQLPITSKPIPTATSKPETTARPQPPTTEHVGVETSEQPEPEITERPQTTARPEQPPTFTNEPQPPATNKPQPPTTASSQKPTNTQSQTTVTPQQPTTARPQPPTTSQMASQTTSRPKPPTTTTAKPPLTARPQPSSTVKPQPTTAEPQSTTTSRPQPTTTIKPHSTTGRPQSTTTTIPQSPTTARPQPTTAEPQSTTTSRPQPTTTIKPHSTTGRPQSTTTTIPQSPTTARPQPTTTIKPHPTTDTPQPSSTAASQSTTESPQPSTTSVTTPSCPQNSHYTTCIPACSPTCAHLNGPPGCSDNKSCIQGCVCDAGFVQKGRVCVPIQQCGCVDRNGTKHQFDEVWYANHCSQKCECEKHQGVGKIDCDNKEECDGNAVCLQNEEGDYYCQPTDFNECTIKKDNEYRTFDKMKYDFEGEHSYVLVQTKNLPNNLQEVYIEGINTRIVHDDDEDSQQHGDSSSEEDHSRSDEDDDDSEEHEEHQILQELKIRVYNHTVELKKKRRLVVDGKRTNTPIAPTAGLNIYEHFSRIYLKTDFGLSVEFDGQSTAEIILPRIYRRKVGGLCGNFDSQKQNDWMKPDGTRARSVQEFGESWRV